MKVHINSSRVVTKIEKYNKPEVIYIPLEDKTGITYKYIVKEGDYINKGQVVAVNEKTNFPIHSSVSGYASFGSNKIINTGKKVKCIAIENDFKEKYQKSKMLKKDLSTYTKEQFIEDLKENAIIGLGGSAFPTYLKYNNDNIKYLLVNGVECEPHISSDKALMYNYSENILEAIDAIITINKIKKAIVVIKESDKSSYEALSKYIGTYPNITIKTVKDIYPNGWERNVVKEALGVSYQKYPIEKGVVVSNVSTIYAIYEMLEYNRPLTERIVTFVGPGLKEKKNVKVKIGTLASEVIKNIDPYTNIKNPLFVAGGPMMGTSLPTDDVVITKDLNCILVLENNFPRNSECIRCGKCTSVCPVKLYPVLIMNNINKPNNLEELKPNKCIECGLCSYICPSKIEVREFVKAAREKVKDK